MEPKAPHPLIERLSLIQERDGLSGTDLARRLEVNPSTVTRLKRGEIRPSLRIVQMVHREFPELRSFCAGLLRIGQDDVADKEYVEAAS